MELTLKDVTIKVDDIVLIAGANVTLRSGELVALLGPNGAGKTTLLRAALGLAQITSGQVMLDGVKIGSLTPMSRARKMTYLPQMRPLAWPNRVRDIVALGRYSHGAAFGRLGSDDASAVSQAIDACDIAHLAERKADSLSGGELARVHCARAFAAQVPLLIADEPIAALDPRHQHRIMSLVKAYVENTDGPTSRGALVVLHDIALAAKYADRLIWMKDGEIVADGSPKETVTAQRLADVYGVHARIENDDVYIDSYL